MEKLGGAANVLHESRVEANNWMSALRATREALSERPSIPPGASCSIDAQGVATVLDPSSRRKFVLEPVAEVGAQRQTAASTVEAPPAKAEPARAPEAARAPQPAAQAAASAAELRKRFETVPLVPEERAPAPAVTAGAPVAAAPARPAAAEPAAASAKKKKFDTVAFTDARAAAPAPAAGPAPSPRVPARPISSDVRPSHKPPAELELLLTRDDEPTPGNPLCYRERAYLLTRGTTVPEAEAALRWKLADLQKALEDRPRGKLVHLAVFDHRWQDVPERPPVISLEWRDWRGEVIVDYPAAARESSLPPPSRPGDDRLPEVFEALSELTRLHTPAEGLDFAVKLLARTIPSQAISACLYDINTDELRFVALSGTNSELMQGHAVSRSAGLFGVAARVEGQASVFADVTIQPAFDPEVDSRPGLDARTMLLRPIVHDRHLMGMLQLINRTGPDAFSAQDVNAINYVAERLGEFLHRTRMQARGPA